MKHIDIYGKSRRIKLDNTEGTVKIEVTSQKEENDISKLDESLESRLLSIANS